MATDAGSRETQRMELHRAIWAIADEVRGAVDGWDFKAYILCFLFYRFISEDLAEYIDAGEREAGDPTFSYAELADEDAEGAREDLVEVKGYFILPSQLFQNVAKAPEKDPELNIHVDQISRRSRARPSARRRRRTSRASSTTWTSRPTSWAPRSRSASTAWPRSSRVSATWISAACATPT